MEIRNRETGELTTVSQFKALHPRTSFPRVVTVEVLDAYGYDPVLNGPAAAISGPYEISVRDGVEEIGGQWFTKFVVGPIFNDTTDEDGNTITAAEQQAAFEQRIDDDTAAGVRATRDKLLSETDWVVTRAFETSTEIDAATLEYRQALRDITAQSGFPHEVVWPELA
jgi:hypothetical protein